jgi:type IV pilus assembly protein PilV
MMKRRPNSLAARRQAGVALIEVLVSILLFSLGVLGMIGLQARAIGFSVDAEDRNRAALFANELATVMWMTKSTTIDLTSGTPSWEDRVKDATLNGLPSGTVSITPVGAAFPNSADILITWRTPQRGTNEQDSQLTTRVTVPPP